VSDPIDPRPTGPALAVLELASIARGVTCVDTMVKRAPAEVLRARTVSPGKYIIVLGGGVAEVEESITVGIEAAGSAIVDRLFLPNAHPTLWPVMQGVETPEAAAYARELDALAIVETASVASTVLAADVAAKAADVALLIMRLAIGLGGKGFFTMSGPLDQIQAAVEASMAAIDAQLQVGVEIIPRPHEELLTKLQWQ
jgi:microcompartment protein CcmL/EutN